MYTTYLLYWDGGYAPANRHFQELKLGGKILNLSALRELAAVQSIPSSSVKTHTHSLYLSEIFANKRKFVDPLHVR
jgi:hypothetical protein